jgi:hypothetical protein
MDMTGIDPERRKRFYLREAWVQLPGSVGVCEKKTVGLVGLHIVVKTKTRPQWIWASFEQVDNVPPKPGDRLRTSFNDGSGQPMPDRSPTGWPPTPIPPPPVNLDRIKPIHDSTQDTNRKYQAAIRAQDPNSVWQFYELVMTQWPTGKLTDPGTPDFTFPGRGTDQTAFANITMETWDQKDIFLGCMNCHNIANAGQSKTDFVWALWTKSFEPSVAGRKLKLTTQEPLQKLMDLLTTHQTPAGQK